MTVFQRTPPWVVPKLDRRIDPSEQALFARVPLTQKALRGLIFAITEGVGVAITRYPWMLQARRGLESPGTCAGRSRTPDAPTADPELPARLQANPAVEQLLSRSGTRQRQPGDGRDRAGGGQLGRDRGRRRPRARRARAAARASRSRRSSPNSTSAAGAASPSPRRGRTGSRPIAARPSPASPTRRCCPVPTPAPGVPRRCT